MSRYRYFLMRNRAHWLRQGGRPCSTRNGSSSGSWFTGAKQGPRTIPIDPRQLRAARMQPKPSFATLVRRFAGWEQAAGALP